MSGSSRLLLALYVTGLAMLAPPASSADAPVSAPTAAQDQADLPIQKYFPAPNRGVPGRYIVALNLGSTASAAPQLVGEVGGTLGYIYRHIFTGFEADLTEEQAERLSTNRLVRYVVQDRSMDEDPVSAPPPHCYQGYDQNENPFPSLPSPSNPQPSQDLDCSDLSTSGNCIDNWGLDRIDRIGAPKLDTIFSYRQAAASIEVYVLDTGVDRENREFLNSTLSNSRVLPGIRTYLCSPFPTDPDCADGHTACTSSTSVVAGGHGTHVAGIIGGRTFGLAKGVTIIPIKALCTNLSMGNHLLGLEWILEDHSVEEPTAIVNISGLNGLGLVPGTGGHCSYYDPSCGPGLAYRDAMISLASRDNLLVVQSAGNQSFAAIPNTDPTEYYGLAQACDHSFGDESDYPANSTARAAISRIVIAAGTNDTDGRWQASSTEWGYPFGSNMGNCVDIFAPAGRINSSFYRRNLDPLDSAEVVCELSGTSMAAPHVTGVAAMILQTSPSMSAPALRAMLLRYGEAGVLQSSIGTGSPNLLVHWDTSDVFVDGFETHRILLWEAVP